jgi:hypothetical protein
MHLLQTRMLAAGKLWTAPHPLAEFFETFHVVHQPVYAPIYFPGTALVSVPAVWLNLPFWFLPLMVAGACAAILYLIVTELMDGVSGLLAAMMLVSLQWFRYLSLMVMSQTVMALIGLLLIFVWLRWREKKSLKLAAVIGALMGFAAITRPVDALVFSIPIGVAMLIELRHAGLRRIGATVGLIVTAAVPFLALQVIENVGVTGEPFKTPYRLYADLYTPQMSFGFHEFDPNVRPRTSLPQKQDYYDVFTAPIAREHRPGNIANVWLRERSPLIAKVTLPNRVLLALLPLGFLALSRPDARLIWAILLLYIGFYALFSYLLPFYLVVIAPIIIIAALYGKFALEQLAGRWRTPVSVALTVGIALCCIAALPELNREVIDDGFPAPAMWLSYKLMPQDLELPAIVLFRYRKGDNINEEPVYNIDVVNPDDAPIIRAHDLGVAKDRELFAYYAQRQPQRTVYLFDRASRQLVRLGKVTELLPPTTR